MLVTVVIRVSWESRGLLPTRLVFERESVGPVVYSLPASRARTCRLGNSFFPEAIWLALQFGFAVALFCPEVDPLHRNAIPCANLQWTIKLLLLLLLLLLLDSLDGNFTPWLCFVVHFIWQTGLVPKRSQDWALWVDVRPRCGKFLIRLTQPPPPPHHHDQHLPSLRAYVAVSRVQFVCDQLTPLRVHVLYVDLDRRLYPSCLNRRTYCLRRALLVYVVLIRAGKTSQTWDRSNLKKKHTTQATWSMPA